jgi:hypothetical protein
VGSLLTLEDRIKTLGKKFALGVSAVALVAVAYGCGGGAGNGATNGNATSTPTNPSGAKCPAYNGRGNENACTEIANFSRGVPSEDLSEDSLKDKLILCGGVIGKYNPVLQPGEPGYHDINLVPNAQIDMNYVDSDGNIVKSENIFANEDGYYKVPVKPGDHILFDWHGHLNGTEIIGHGEYKEPTRPAGQFCMPLLPILPEPTALNENPLLNASYVLVAKPQVRPDYMKLLKG